MHQLFGVSQTSLASVFDFLNPHCLEKDLNIVVVDSQTQELPKAHFYLILGYKTLVRKTPDLLGKRAVALVFDTPLQLCEIRGLKFLDMEKPKLSYLFRLIPLNTHTLNDLIEVASNSRLNRLDYDAQQFEVLPKLLEMIQKGHFLDKFNNLLYSTTNHDTRNNVRLQILRYLFGKIEIGELRDRLRAIYRRGEAVEYAKKVIRYLKDDDGHKLRTALCAVANKRAKSKRRQVQYTSIAKKFGVDRYELKYLSKIYRASLKENRFKPITLAEAGARPPPSAEELEGLVAKT